MPRPMTPAERRASAEERLWASLVESEAGCWVWTGALQDGYGRMWSGERPILVHRFAYEIVVAQPPIWPLQLDHLCRNRACANPAHLEVVRPVENVRRGAKVLDSHCRNGHRRTPATTYLTVDNSGRRRRSCAVCARESTARYLEKKKAA